MTKRIDCGTARRHLPDLVDGPADAGVAQHVRSCAACKEELAAFSAVLAAAAGLEGLEAPDPGHPYWEAFLPSVRARIARHGHADAAARRRRALAAAAAASVMIVAAGVSLLVSVSAPGSPGRPAVPAPAPSVEEAGRRLDEAMGRMPAVAEQTIADLIGAEPLSELDAGQIRDALRRIDPPPGLMGAWTEPGDDELRRMLDGLEAPQIQKLRAELSAERS